MLIYSLHHNAEFAALFCQQQLKVSKAEIIIGSKPKKGLKLQSTCNPSCSVPQSLLETLLSPLMLTLTSAVILIALQKTLSS